MSRAQETQDSANLSETCQRCLSAYPLEVSLLKHNNVTMAPKVHFQWCTILDFPGVVTRPPRNRIYVCAHFSPRFCSTRNRPIKYSGGFSLFRPFLSSFSDEGISIGTAIWTLELCDKIGMQDYLRFKPDQIF